jgi:class 3 adenylate cyclase
MRCPSCGNENREEARFCDSCGTELAAAPERATVPVESAPEGAPAEVGGGRYRIKSFLGQGGRKLVYLADDAAGDREVAVAIFDTAGVGEAIQARARREAQAMGKLGDHPHVVSVLDTGEEGGGPFIVSEYMPGGDVEGLLSAEGGRLAVPRAIEIAADVCRALEHAHARDIVHRDLKPANVWLDDDGRARLGDFGLATTEGRSRMSGGTVVGTVAYLPPEQAIGEVAGPESDLYSLGALLYEMLTGRPPFLGDDAVAIISQHLHADPVPPSRHNPDVPEALDRVVLGLLAKRREDRPSSAAEVRESLGAALAEPPAREGDEAAENPLDSLAGGVYVGRETEMERMRAAVDGAIEGQGRLLLVVGEPGIGKTRAAEELATYATVRGARVHWGRCREDEGAPAYWPWVQAMRSYARESDPVALQWQMGGGAPEIAQLVPEVAERQEGAPAATGETEEARFRLFDSVTTFLCNAANDRPLVLVLDDLHWADEPTLLLLKFAAREVGSSGLLIVGTYRDVELGRHHPLARVLGELAEVEAAERISLGGLDVDDVERYIGMTAGGTVPAGLARAVHSQTDGNPFFVGEVVRLLASEGRLTGPADGSWDPAIPQGVREVVGRRLDRLSPATNEALKVAAAIGREFDVEVARRVAELSDEELMTAATEAVAERLVTEAGPGRFSFAHALVRDTLYEEITPAQRSLLHERIGLAIEELRGDDPGAVGELAHHFLSAAPRGDPARAIGYAERAAGEALAKFAYEEAAEFYERALEVMELSDLDDDARRCELLLWLGLSQTSAGCVADAREAFDHAVEVARARGDADELSRAVLGLAALTEAGRVNEDLISLITEALEAIGTEDSPRRAALLSALGQELYWVDPQGKSLPVVNEAVELARRIGDDRSLARALHRAIFLPLGPDGTEERLAIANEMLELGRRLDDRETLILAHAYRLREFLEQGDIPALDRELESYVTLAAELRMPHHQWFVPSFRAMRALLEGDLRTAESLAEEARIAGERAEQPVATQFYGIQMISLRRLQGRSEELLPAVRGLVERFPAIPAWRTARASLAATAGDSEEASAELERLAADDFAAIPRDINWLPAIALMGEAAALVGDRALAESLLEKLRPYDGKFLVVGRAASTNGPVARVLGLLCWTMGRHDEAQAYLELGIEQSRRIGDRPFIALARAELGRVLLERADPEDRERALDLLGESISMAREMGARGVADFALELRLEAQGLAGVDVTTSIDDVVAALETERPNLHAHAAPDGTVAILFSDIEDSTVLTERLGDERWLEVLREHNSVFRREISRHDGFEVKSQGDGFMLAFPDPCDALACAADVQRAFAEREVEDDAEALRIRMGLHTGEVIAEEGDFFGKNVILAARIAAQAHGGEILVSESLRDAVQEPHGDAGGVSFDDGRELELKGLAGTHRVYRAEWSESGTGAAAPA